MDLNPTTGAETRTVRYMKHGDSLHITTQAAERTERMVAAPAEWLPFIDLVHWPFDVALRRLRSSGASTVGAPMLSGQRVSPFPLALIGRDSATVTHPTRGTMRLTVLPDGSIRTLDAGATTRASIVTRSGNLMWSRSRATSPTVTPPAAVSASSPGAAAARPACSAPRSRWTTACR